MNETHTKQLFWAAVRVPENPRARFFLKSAVKCKFDDITLRVSKLVIEDLQDGTGFCNLLRLDDQEKLVWKTRHQSVRETKWYVEFEYGLPEDKWNPYDS